MQECQRRSRVPEVTSSGTLLPHDISRAHKSPPEIFSRNTLAFSLEISSSEGRNLLLPDVLQCVAVCCSVLQCVAVCCSVLQEETSCGEEEISRQEISSGDGLSRPLSEEVSRRELWRASLSSGSAPRMASCEGFNIM